MSAMNSGAIEAPVYVTIRHGDVALMLEYAALVRTAVDMAPAAPDIAAVRFMKPRRKGHDAVEIYITGHGHEDAKEALAAMVKTLAAIRLQDQQAAGRKVSPVTVTVQTYTPEA